MKKLNFGKLNPGNSRKRFFTDFLTTIAGYGDRLYAVAIEGEETTLAAEDGASAARAVGFDACAQPSLSAALKTIREEASIPGRVMICGSLYLAGAALAENKTPPGGGAS